MLQVRTQENTSCRKKCSNSLKTDRSKIKEFKSHRSKITNIKFLQNSILAQTLIERLGFHLNFFKYKREMLSYDFFHNISVRLFNDKKCSNCKIYFLVFLWDLFVMGLVLSGKDLIKTVESHTRSTCKKVNSQVRC